MQRRFYAQGKTLAEFCLHLPPTKETQVDRGKIRHDPAACHTATTASEVILTEEQKAVHDAIMTLSNTSTGGLIYINGPAGTGKTFLVHKLRANGKIVLCSATTGIAAMNYPGGKTAHSTFNLPVKEDPRDLKKIQCDVSFNSEKGASSAKQAQPFGLHLQNHHANFQAVDEILRKICHILTGRVVFFFSLLQEIFARSHLQCSLELRRIHSKHA